MCTGVGARKTSSLAEAFASDLLRLTWSAALYQGARLRMNTLLHDGCVTQPSNSPHMMESCWTLMLQPVHLRQCDVLKNLTEAIFARSQGPSQKTITNREDHYKYNPCGKINQEN